MLISDYLVSNTVIRCLKSFPSKEPETILSNYLFSLTKNSHPFPMVRQA